MISRRRSIAYLRNQGIWPSRAGRSRYRDEKLIGSSAWSVARFRRLPKAAQTSDAQHPCVIGVAVRLPYMLRRRLSCESRRSQNNQERRVISCVHMFVLDEWRGFLASAVLLRASAVPSNGEAHPTLP